MSGVSKQSGLGDPDPRPWWRRKRYFALMVILALFGRYLWPLVNPNWAQDACEFGVVSNERYRALLADAKVLAESDWDNLTEAAHASDRDAAIAILQRQYDQLGEGLISIQERIAALHAVMRAQGAEYQVTIPDVENPFQEVSEALEERISRTGRNPIGPLLVNFEYRLDVNKLGIFRPITMESMPAQRWARIFARFGVFSAESQGPLFSSFPANKIRMGIRFSHNNAGPTFAVNKNSDMGFDCPPVPDLTWSEEFIENTRNLPQ